MANAQMFDINVSAMESLKHALNATQAQYIGAYNRALTRTVSKLYRDSVTLMLEQAGVRKKSTARRRVKDFKKQRSGGREGRSLSGLQIRGAKIWYGLNPFRLHELKGKISGTGDSRRKNKGATQKTGKVTFIPTGKGLSPVTFDSAFIGKRYGYRSVWIRGEDSRIREARIPVAEGMEDAIDDHIFNNIGPIFWRYFEQDLSARVAANIHFDPKTGRRA
ncbi:hypothetical protein [Kluyvera intermedia]|uniref:hypothetical protein n=1 Tax=Kluyvera intermedia TaxID=61648 RepID=UPI0035250638